MQTIALFVNDAGAAQRVAAPLVRAAAPSRWIVVACPPALSRHAGRFLGRAARRARREAFGAELFAALSPILPGPVETLVAGRALSVVAAGLRARFPDVQCIDARHERLGAVDEALGGATAGNPPAWAAPAAAAAGLSLMLALAD